ncbi:hypothetical protein K493DRAFT_319642 [Basidiobolus meristosporus CBS 931.73]|uniref:Uncharacterized protein n=1 Tax=Basidiobolus meristosporus CBS 931.73 TaxID=1314790 RepID=A0A1Y1XP61_9FUNG|nr:hypothetical protein K493DRAFT_319642 [Basidiobolus meristosporus CBS 931.73]|eukprot:ORX87530.1 hypothetical protein K493DRAFT_319642 [Basidiobolus meristosporus CBS 931.73]
MSDDSAWVHWANHSFVAEIPLEPKQPDHSYLPIACSTTLKRNQFSDDESELSLDLEEEATPTSKKPRHLYWPIASQTTGNDPPAEGRSMVLPSQFKPLRISTRTSHPTEPDLTEYEDINQLLNAAHNVRRQAHPAEEEYRPQQFSAPAYQNYQNINEVLRELHLNRRGA